MDFYWPRLIIIFLAISNLSACASFPRDHFTLGEQQIATPLGFTNIRFSESDMASLNATRSSFWSSRKDRQERITFLSLSGGGANGAYGAGVLYGWTQSGRRPPFDIVAGVSTGALAAPFAFLGSNRDAELKDAFTGSGASHLLDSGGILSALFGDSFFSIRPLERLVNSYIDDEVVRAVAAESAKGRMLLVTTTNLDTQQLVVWNMGAIAATGGPQATALFRKVLLASASVPAVFPPAMIQVHAKGRTFSEMHVDGGTVNAFFAVPEPLFTADKPSISASTIDLYLILNQKIEPKFEITDRSLKSVLKRSYDTLSKSGTRTSLAAVSEFGKRAGVKVHVASIPGDMDAEAMNFDQAVMAALFERGREFGVRGLSSTLGE